MAARCLAFGLRSPRSKYFVPLFAGASRSSSGIVEAGKLKGKSFEDALAQDAQYCSWVLKRGDEMGDRYTDFLAFLRARTQADPEEASSRSSYAGHAVTSDAVSAQGEESGSDELVGFGKHRDMSYTEMVKTEPDYCRWALDKTRNDPDNASPAMKAFASYLEGVELPKGKYPPKGGSRQSGGYAKPRESGGWSGTSSYGGGAGAGSYGGGAGAGRTYPDKNKPGILAEGAWPVTFGKHQGKTFAQVFEQDTKYCEWLVNSILVKTESVSAEQLAMTVYVMHRAGQA